MRVSKAVPRIFLAGLAFLVLALFSPSAKADTIDFGCGGAQQCTGTVLQSGSNYSSTGIGVSASYDPTDSFTLLFDTSNNTISIDENGGPDQFVGTITNLSISSTGGFTTLDMGVDWNTVPSSLGNWGLTPFPSGSVVSISISGSALSVDIPIATPEPGVLVLLSAGMVALGLMLKRKAGVLV